MKWKSKSLCDKVFDVKLELFGGRRVLSFATSELVPYQYNKIVSGLKCG